MRIQAGLGETVRMALANIWARKVRSALTLLRVPPAYPIETDAFRIRPL